MLKSIKSKIKSAQEDIKKNLKTLTRSNPSVPESEAVEFDGALRLLDKYEQNWETVHKDAESNASIAADIDVRAGKLTSRFESKFNDFFEFDKEVQCLNGLSEQLDGVAALINSLQSVCSLVEASLVVYEDAVEEDELKKSKAMLEAKLKNHKKNREDDYAKLRVHLQYLHEHQVRALELENQNKLKERAAAFDEEFRKDIQEFKGAGTLLGPLGRLLLCLIEFLVDRAPSTSSSKDLSEVAIEDDRTALEEFLNGVDASPEENTGMENSLETDEK